MYIRDIKDDMTTQKKRFLQQISPTDEKEQHMFHFKMMHIELRQRILNQSQNRERHTKRTKKDIFIIYLLRINIPGTRINTKPLEQNIHCFNC